MEVNFFKFSAIVVYLFSTCGSWVISVDQIVSLVCKFKHLYLVFGFTDVVLTTLTFVSSTPC